MVDALDGDGRQPVVKSPKAFRTISEVADELAVPQHVLRFWETRFAQLRPLKRGGGRRYYRPEDVALLRRIRALLYDDGYTIKGVQKLLREGSRGARETEGGAPEAPPPPPPPAREAAPPAASPPDPRARRLRALTAELTAVRDSLRARA
ncbi:MAG: MerR family transcriptional regulator [Alphaproteobacteria bacterium]|nr:MerR family transcriptional regulator [Alphaproteobacteria bacterium]